MTRFDNREATLLGLDKFVVLYLARDKCVAARFDRGAYEISARAAAECDLLYSVAAVGKCNGRAEPLSGVFCERYGVRLGYLGGSTIASSPSEKRGAASVNPSFEARASLTPPMDLSSGVWEQTAVMPYLTSR